MHFSVLQFPGSNCDQDCVHVLSGVLGQQADYLWHKEESLGSTDAVVVPGGFSYGDYLRTGSIAQFSPVMKKVKKLNIGFSWVVKNQPIFQYRLLNDKVVV